MLIMMISGVCDMDENFAKAFKTQLLDDNKEMTKKNQKQVALFLLTFGKKIQN